MAHIFGVAIVGYGEMGQLHTRTWAGMPNVRIAAVVDPIEAKLLAARSAYRCHIFADLGEMFDRAQGGRIRMPDIVVIATHVPYHYMEAVLAAHSGCHVVCEKPMASTLIQCDGMINAAKEAGVRLAVHHQCTFSRGFKEARRLIVAGEIGELQMLRAYGKGRIACSDLMEIAGHLADGMRYLAGAEPVSVYGDVTVNGRDITREDAARVKDLYPEGRESGVGAGDRIIGLYKFANGVRAELQLTTLEGAPGTFNEQRNFGFYIDIFGSKERLQLYLPGTLFRNRSPLDDLGKGATPWEEVDPSFREEDVYGVLMRRFAEDFVGAIRDARPPLISGEVGRMAMEMTLGAYASHLTGRPLPIPIANRNHPFKP